jgi:threonyl-tRNA synthetase
MQRGADMITDDDKWESLAAEYLRRLASEDMLQWARYWKFAERSQGGDADLPDISKTERDHRKIVRLTSREAIAS